MVLRAAKISTEICQLFNVDIVQGANLPTEERNAKIYVEILVL